MMGAVDTIFEFLLTVHLTTGILCLLSGPVAMAARKRQGIHTLAGRIYHAAYFILFLTAVSMSIVHWSESSYLFYIAMFSYGLVLWGVLEAKKRGKGWIGRHITGTAGSYIGIVTAILVVNHEYFPGVNQLPQLALWFLPTVIGTPFIVRVTLKYKR